MKQPIYKDGKPACTPDQADGLGDGSVEKLESIQINTSVQMFEFMIAHLSADVNHRVVNQWFHDVLSRHTVGLTVVQQPIRQQKKPNTIGTRVVSHTCLPMDWNSAMIRDDSVHAFSFHGHYSMSSHPLQAIYLKKFIFTKCFV